MLEILLAEHGDIGRRLDEQLGHNGRHPGKVAGPDLALEAIGDTGFHLGAGLYFGWQGHHHGEWRGELVVDGERLADCSDPDLTRQLHQIRDTVVRIRDLDTGAEGVGNCQPIVAGGFPALGLTKETSFW